MSDNCDYDIQYLDWLANHDSQIGGDAWSERPERRFIGMSEALRGLVDGMDYSVEAPRLLPPLLPKQRRTR